MVSNLLPFEQVEGISPWFGITLEEKLWTNTPPFSPYTAHLTFLSNGKQKNRASKKHSAGGAMQKKINVW